MPQDDSNAGRGDVAPTFVCSRTHGAVDVGWVRIAGALDCATAPRLKRVLRERRLRKRLVVLDLRELTFMDSIGAHAVVDASIRARKAGRRLVVMHVAPQVRGIFAKAGSSGDVEFADLHLVEPRVQWFGPPVQRKRPPAGGGRAA